MEKITVEYPLTVKYLRHLRTYEKEKCTHCGNEFESGDTVYWMNGHTCITCHEGKSGSDITYFEGGDKIGE